ncbi:MAG: FapA family protein [Sulfuricurvum sp.]|nr:FapA family protein [Sulfuricurvum sp.]
MAEFTPVTKASTSVKEDLRFAASDRKISLGEVDFDLLSYETYYKKSTDKEEHVVQSGNVFAQFTQEELYSSEFLLCQEYQIKIRPPIPMGHLDLRYSLAMNKTKGVVTAVIDPESIIPLKKGVQEWIKTEINKKKLRLGYLIGMEDEVLDKEILRLLSTIQKNGSLTEPYRMPIASFFPAIDVINDSITLSYKQANTDQEEASFITGVQSGDLLLVYVFPKKGRNGRGLDGAPIIVPEPTIKYAGVIQVDDKTISSTKDENGIRFFALVSGFVKRVKGVFVVSQELYLEAVNAKTGSILPGADKEIFLRVEQKDPGEDAVSAGLRIDIQTVDISGTIGEHTNIKACDVSIDAQTHMKSTIDVTGVANIKLHRGNLKAKEANIDVLEGGIIEGDIVRVNKMLGGDIIAREVHIGILFAHSKITALESIEIQAIEGEGHRLSIDPLSVPAYHAKKSEFLAQIEEKVKLLQSYRKELGMKQIVFKEKNAQAKRAQQRTIEAKKGGFDPLETDIITIRQYRAEADRLQVFTAKVAQEEGQLYIVRDLLKRLEESDMYGTIKHHGVYQGHSRVSFIDPITRQEYTAFPKGIAVNSRLQKKGDEKIIVYN